MKLSAIKNFFSADYYTPKRQFYKKFRIPDQKEVDEYVSILTEKIEKAKKSRTIFANSKTLPPIIQRGLDLTIASILAIPFGLTAGVAAIISKVTNPNLPVFHTQQRIGQYGKMFKMFKIRTVERTADQWRILSEYTKFLRRHGIDEFPQLINVFKGDMSFMGPRPVLFVDILDKNKQFGDNYVIKRCILKPGFGFGYEPGRKYKKPLNIMEEEFYQDHGIKTYFKTLKELAKTITKGTNG